MSESLNDARRSFMAGQRRIYGHEADSPRLEVPFVSGWIACCNDFRNRANNLLPVGQPFSHTTTEAQEEGPISERGSPIEAADFLRKSISESFLFSPTAQRAVETLIAALANVTLATPGHLA
jgi:hypothetical protein